MRVVTGIALLATLLGATDYYLLHAQQLLPPEPSRAALLRAFPGRELTTFENAERFELLQLSQQIALGCSMPKCFYDGSQITGRTFISDSVLKRKLVTAIHNSAIAIEGEEGTRSPFASRYVIRASRKNKRVDVIVNFQAGQMTTFGSDGKGATYITREALPLFDSVWQKTYGTKNY